MLMGAQHGAHGLHGAGENARQADMEQKERQADEHGDHIEIAEDVAQGDGPLSAQEHPAVAPQQGDLHHHVHAGKEQPLLAQNGGHHRNQQIDAVGVDHAGLLHGAQVQRAAQQGRQHQHQKVDQDGCPEGEQHGADHVPGKVQLV